MAWHGLKQIDWIIEQRIQTAQSYDTGLSDCPGVTIPPRDPLAKQVYHTYVITVDRREELQRFLDQRGIQTKVHYPTPVHLQPGYRFLGYEPGSFPACEAPIPGVSGERLAGLIKAHGHPCVRYVPRGEVTTFMQAMAHPGDTIFFLGAGDIGDICHDMASGLRSTARVTR